MVFLPPTTGVFSFCSLGHESKLLISSPLLAHRITNLAEPSDICPLLLSHFRLTPWCPAEEVSPLGNIQARKKAKFLQQEMQMGL